MIRGVAVGNKLLGNMNNEYLCYDSNKQNKKILVIDDDNDLSFIIREMLVNYGYDVACAYDGEAAFSMLTDNSFDLILLDINLGEVSGFDICKELRRVSTIPIIFASARTAESDRITGLDIGGDDYLEKPYSLKELLSHVNAIMRRTYGYSKSEEKLVAGCISVDPVTRRVFKGDKEVQLSLKEFDVLAYLMKNRGAVVTKEELLTNIWGAFCEVEPSTVTVHIRWLREKLEENPAKPEYIETVWGKGYRIGVTNEN